MPDGIQQLNEDIIAAARILSREGLVQGFGHVSARIPDSDLFVITPRVSLELVEANQLVVLNLQGQVLEAPVSPSFETALHTAIFNARPEVKAITRIHARTANIFSVTDTPLEAVHNHGSFFSGGGTGPQDHRPHLHARARGGRGRGAGGCGRACCCRATAR